MTTPKRPGVQIWQMNLLWPMETPVPEQRCLEYQYTKLGRWTYFGQLTPPSTRAEMPWIPVHETWQMNLLWPMYPPGTRAEMPWIPVHKTWQMNLLWPMYPPGTRSRDALNTSTQNVADEPTLANGPHSTRAEMPWIPVQKTWQINLLWPMDPPVPEQRCLEYQYTILSRWTYFGQWTPKVTEQRCLNTATDI